MRVAEQGVEVTGEGGGFDRVPVWPREDVPAALPARARVLLLLLAGRGAREAR
jgi:hypothetical protein